MIKVEIFSTTKLQRNLENNSQTKIAKWQKTHYAFLINLINLECMIEMCEPFKLYSQKTDMDEIIRYYLESNQYLKFYSYLHYLLRRCFLQNFQELLGIIRIKCRIKFSAGCKCFLSGVVSFSHIKIGTTLHDRSTEESCEITSMSDVMLTDSEVLYQLVLLRQNFSTTIIFYKSVPKPLQSGLWMNTPKPTNIFRYEYHKACLRHAWKSSGNSRNSD